MAVDMVTDLFLGFNEYNVLEPAVCRWGGDIQGVIHRHLTTHLLDK